MPGSAPIGWFSLTVADPDAAAFISAAGITDPTQQSAIYQLVDDMKGVGNYANAVWSSMYAVYPFVGGSASSHAYNLINTAAYEISWSGGMGHASDGITGNGTNAFGNTLLNANTVLTKTNTFLGAYCGTNTAQNGYDMAATTGSSVVGFISRYGANEVYYRPFNAGVNQTTSTDSRGWNYTMRNNTTQLTGGKNNTRTVYNVNYDTTNINEFIYILAMRTSGGGVTAYSNKNLRFAVIGQALTTAQMDDFYNMIQDFQTTLGRQV